MKLTVAAAGLLLLCGGSIPAQTQTPDSGSTSPLVAWYHDQYPFISMNDSIYTFESEFTVPEGYFRPDSSELTPFQNWISRFPIWHQYKAVGIWKGGKAFEKDQVSRVVHIPWRGPTYTDVGFPLRILSEYCRRNCTEFGLRFVTKGDGDTLDYARWLKSKEAISALGSPRLVPAPERDSSEFEFYRFLNMAMQHQTYRSLAANGDSLSAEQVRPGDLLVGHDDRGRTGKAYVILNMLVNDLGDRLYAVATGCPAPDACDFHIPLVTLDRSFPWLTQVQLEALVNEYPHWGYIRLRIPEPTS